MEQLCCIARRIASVVVALPCRTCPIANPSMQGKTLHHQMPGSNRSHYCAHEYQKLPRQHGLKPCPLTHANMRCRAADERQGQGQRLRHFCRRKRLQIPQGRTDLAQELRKPGARSKSPSLTTSTASTTRAADTQRSAGNPPWPSNARPPDMSTSPEQNRGRSTLLGSLLASKITKQGVYKSKGYSRQAGGRGGLDRTPDQGEARPDAG